MINPQIIQADDLIDFACCPILANSQTSVASTPSLAALRAIAAFHLLHSMSLPSGRMAVRSRWKAFSSRWVSLYKAEASSVPVDEVTLLKLFQFLDEPNPSAIVGVNLPCRLFLGKKDAAPGSVVEATALGVLADNPVTILHISPHNPGVDLVLYTIVSVIGNEFEPIQTRTFATRKGLSDFVIEAIWDRQAILTCKSIVDQMGSLISKGFSFPNPEFCPNCPIRAGCKMRIGREIKHPPPAFKAPEWGRRHQKLPAKTKGKRR